MVRMEGYTKVEVGDGGGKMEEGRGKVPTKFSSWLGIEMGMQTQYCL